MMNMKMKMETETKMKMKVPRMMIKMSKMVIRIKMATKTKMQTKIRMEVPRMRLGSMRRFLMLTYWGMFLVLRICCGGMASAREIGFVFICR